MATAGKPRRRGSLLLRKGSSSSSPIQDVVISEKYDVIKQLGTGRFGYICLANDRATGITLGLKIFPRETVKLADYLREYNFSFYLSAHPNIIDVYEGLYSTPDRYFFVQEFCPCASLREAVEATSGNGLPESTVKTIMRQVLGALLFMHAEKLVHRNVQAKNVLIFEDDYSRVKLTDFGLTRKEDTLVRHFDKANPFHAPELCDCLIKETYAVQRSVDVWAVGVLMFYCLRGRVPWDKATIMTKAYWEWEEWVKGKRPQLPQKWTKFTEKGLKLFRKALNPKPKDRCSIKDIEKKFMKVVLTKDIKVNKSQSVSEEDLRGLLAEPPNSGLTPSSSGTQVRQSQSATNFMSVPSPPESQRGPLKRRTFLHSFLANTINAMAEISEQVVSAND